MPRFITEFFKSSCFLDEVTRRWWFDNELEASVDECLQDDSHGHITIVCLCPIIEFFAELHHVDAEGAESLTYLRGWLRVSSYTVDSNC